MGLKKFTTHSILMSISDSFLLILVDDRERYSGRLEKCQERKQYLLQYTEVLYIS